MELNDSMRLAMQDAGCNFLFVQSAQANIGRPSLDTASEAQKKAADEWVKGYALTFDDWAARYGETYAKKNYYGSSGSGDISEEQFEGSMKAAYLLAHHILDASANAKEVAPRLNIRFAQTCIKLEDGLMALGIISGVLDEDVVRVPDAESGYGVMTEIGCIAIGDDVVILTAPGELSPALLLGTDPNYTDQYLWTGKTSWSGEDWPYESLTALVRRAAQDDDKTVLLYGITNDALGYIYPDVMMPQSLLATLLFYPCPSNHKADMTNSVLLTTGSKAASQLMESFIKLIGSN